MPDSEDKKLLTDTVSVCSLNLDSIIIALDVKARSKVKDARILNSAIEKDKEFRGPGEHIIAALPKSGEIIYKKDALVALKTYVQWFNGPEVAKKVTENVIWELNDKTGEPIDKKDKETLNNEIDDEESDDTNESVYQKIPSCLTYLTEATGDNGKDEDDIDNNKSDKDPGLQSETAKGYYITYGIEIEGEKGTPLSDALKTFGAGLLKGLGIQSFDWRSGATGKVHTIGDAIDTLSDVFGKMDPDTFLLRFNKNLKAKYPQTTANNTAFFDKNTLLSHLKKVLSTQDRSLITTSDYSFCVKVPHNDKSDKLITKNVIADLATQSIKGLFKKFKNRLTEKDVILINSYSGNKKEETSDKDVVKTNNESTKLNFSSILKLILEDDNVKSLSVEEKLKLISDLLSSALKTEFGNQFSNLTVDKHQAIADKLDKLGIKKADNSHVYDSITKHDYTFLFELIGNSDENTSTQELTNDSLKSIYKCVNLLFEDGDSETQTELSRKLRDTILKTWIKFLKQYKILPNNTKIEEPELLSCVSENNNVIENINNIKNVTNLIFEDYSFTTDIQDILYDSYHNNLNLNLLLEGHNKYYLSAVAELKRVGVENLKNNLDKFNDEYKKYIDSMFVKKGYERGDVKLPADLNSKSQNKQTYINLLKKKYIKGSDTNPFLKSVSTAWRKADTMETVLQAFDTYTHKPEDKDPEVPECYAAFKALQDLPSAKTEEPEEDERIEIIFMDTEKPGELEEPLELTDADKEKYEQIGEPVKLIPGEDVNVPTVKNKGKWTFTGFEPDPHDMDESGKTYAMYMDEPVTTIQFYDDKNGSEEIALDNPIVFEDPDDIDETKIEYPNEDEIKDKYKDDKLVFSEFDPDKETLLKNIKPREENKVFIRYIEREPVMVTIEFKDVNPEDPDNENEWTDIEDPITIDIEELDTIKYPEPPEHEGFEFEKWDKSEDELKTEILNAVEDNEKDSDKTKNESYRYFNRRLTLITEATDDETLKFIVKTVYKQKEADKTEGQKQTFYWVCSDNNGLLDRYITVIPKAPKTEFTDPTNEKNKKIVEPVGEPIQYKIGEELELPTPPEFNGYHFTNWNPDIEAIKNLAKKGQDKIITIAEYSGSENTNDAKKDYGEYNIFIIPMKNLKKSGLLENTEKDDERRIAGKKDNN